MSAAKMAYGAWRIYISRRGRAKRRTSAASSAEDTAQHIGFRREWRDAFISGRIIAAIRCQRYFEQMWWGHLYRWSPH